MSFWYLRHVRTNVHDILHSNELTNNKFTPQINIQTFLTSPKIQFPLNTNYLIRNPSIEDDFETNSHLLGDVFIDNCQKFPQIWQDKKSSINSIVIDFFKPRSITVPLHIGRKGNFLFLKRMSGEDFWRYSLSSILLLLYGL